MKLVDKNDKNKQNSFSIPQNIADDETSKLLEEAYQRGTLEKTGSILYTAPTGDKFELQPTGSVYVKSPLGDVSGSIDDTLPHEQQKLFMLAQKGNPEAQGQIADYYCSLDTDAGFKKAAYWLAKAVEQQYYPAMIVLASLCANGKGVEKSLSDAINLLCNAIRLGGSSGFLMELLENVDFNELVALAESGHLGAMWTVGMCYEDGVIVDKNQVESLKWLKKAVDDFDPLSMWVLGTKFAVGDGVDKNHIAAVNLLVTAIESGVTQAKSTILNYIKLKNIQEMACNGNPNAQFFIALCVANGDHVKQDLFTAEKMLRSLLGVKRGAETLLTAVRDLIIQRCPYLLVKVTDKEWADRFLDGEVFMKSLELFSRNVKNAFRDDALEGFAVSFGDGYNHFLFHTDKDGNIEKTGEVGVVDALTWREKVFCLYCLEYDEVKGEFILPDEEMRSFGDTAVVITNPKELLNRVERALKDRYGDSFWWAYKRVSYNVELSKDFKYSEFCKAAPYSYQNEFRIALDLSQNKFTDNMLIEATDFAKIELVRLLNGRELRDENPDSIKDTLTLNIGNIRDICQSMPISELLYLKHNILKEKLPSPEQITPLYSTHEPRPTLCRPICAIPLEDGSFTLGFGASYDVREIELKDGGKKNIQQIWLHSAVL
jgi:TPR repeat protein